MKYSEIEQMEQRLGLQRQEVLQSLSRVEYERKSLDVDSAKDSADQCVTNLSTESLFERSSQRRTMLRLIEAALRRIADGSFGVCITCGQEIQDRRLKALPWTQFCLPCQQEIEDEVGANLAGRSSSPTTEIWRRAG